MTFEKHLHSISRTASLRLDILRKSWRVFHDKSLLERCFRSFVRQFWSTVQQSGARLPIHTLNYWPGSLLWVWFSVTLLFVDQLQFCVCCISSGATRCTRLMMSNLDRICQCGLHVVPWSHIGILIRHLAAEPRSTAWLLILSQCPSGTILLTPCSMVLDCRVSEQGPVRNLSWARRRLCRCHWV